MFIQISPSYHRTLCFETILELKEKLELTDYQALVNGEPQNDEYVIQNTDLVSFALPIHLVNVKKRAQ